MKRAVVRTFLLLAVSGAVLAACVSSQGQNEAELLTVSLQPEVTHPVPTSLPATIVNSDGTLTLIASGSSSCPPIARSATYDPASNTVLVVIYDYRGAMCTMDMRLFQQQLSRAGGEPLPSDVSVTFTAAPASPVRAGDTGAPA